MSGPNVQMPSSPFGENPLRPEWAAFFQSLQLAVFAASRNGSTTSRPTDDFQGRYEGMPYFDRTLGRPIFLKHASSNVWVDATGTVV